MKSKFLTPLDTRDLGNDKKLLLSSFVYQSKRLNREIRVKKGFVHDGESVSRWTPLIYAIVKGKYPKSACIHDWNYQTHELSKRESDLVFLEGMRVEDEKRKSESFWENGIGLWGFGAKIRREMVYIGVKYGGSSSYRSGPERFTIRKI